MTSKSIVSDRSGTFPTRPTRTPARLRIPRGSRHSRDPSARPEPDARRGVGVRPLDPEFLRPRGPQQHQQAVEEGGNLFAMEIFERLESEVRGYCSSFPTVFTRAQGARLTDEDDRSYVDFFSGAGALNYGHNEPRMKRELLRYLTDDGIVHSLDMATSAKAEFLEALEEIVLVPRRLEYRVQFPGPTGTNAVEAALKLARKVTGRETIVSFTNAFHGMTLGSLAITGNGFKRRGAGVPLTLGDTMPFDGYLGDDVDTLDYFDALVADDGSGVDVPAAVILETVQAEGGINVASAPWLRRLEQICRAHGILMIVDDIQVGCGRTGPFFSFERAGIAPDLVCLSKSLSGYGLPLAILLIRPDLDVWAPGEHNGTFRGHNPAFVTARCRARDVLAERRPVATRGGRRRRRPHAPRGHRGDQPRARGRDPRPGSHPGDRLRASPSWPSGSAGNAFERGLIMETAGPEGNVAKVMPPLNIDEVALKDGLDMLEASVHAVARRQDSRRSGGLAMIVRHLEDLRGTRSRGGGAHLGEPTPSAGTRRHGLLDARHGAGSRHRDGDGVQAPRRGGLLHRGRGRDPAAARRSDPCDPSGHPLRARRARAPRAARQVAAPHGVRLQSAVYRPRGARPRRRLPAADRRGGTRDPAGPLSVARRRAGGDPPAQGPGRARRFTGRARSPRPSSRASSAGGSSSLDRSSTRTRPRALREQAARLRAGN